MVNQSRRVAIVTGSAQGIGQGIAARLAADGLDVVVSDVPSKQELLDTVSKEIQDTHPNVKVLGIAADVSSEKDVQSLVLKTVSELGGLDVMVANAGICWMRSILDSSVEDIDRMFAVNYRGVFLCYREAAKVMIEQKRGGRIIGNTLPSLCIFNHTHPKLRRIIYIREKSTKAAIRFLTQSAAGEFGSHGITVNAYAPGPIVTPLMLEVVSKIDPLTQAATIGPSINRVGQAEDVANLLSFDANAAKCNTMSESGIYYVIPDQYGGGGKRLVRRHPPPLTTAPLDDDFDALSRTQGYTAITPTIERIENESYYSHYAYDRDGQISVPMDDDFDAVTYDYTTVGKAQGWRDHQGGDERSDVDLRRRAYEGLAKASPITSSDTSQSTSGRRRGSGGSGERSVGGSSRMGETDVSRREVLRSPPKHRVEPAERIRSRTMSASTNSFARDGELEKSHQETARRAETFKRENVADAGGSNGGGSRSSEVGMSVYYVNPDDYAIEEGGDAMREEVISEVPAHGHKWSGTSRGVERRAIDAKQSRVGRGDGQTTASDEYHGAARKFPNDEQELPDHTVTDKKWLWIIAEYRQSDDFGCAKHPGILYAIATPCLPHSRHAGYHDRGAPQSHGAPERRYQRSSGER
ncbi:hypothetical protein ONZ45_g8170 [Pleurotus djamor]|nr:hypothetical protein ONZ45_g8170 [Pleurotus djamor]